MGSLLYQTVRLVLGTLYPAYSSFKAVKTKNVKVSRVGQPEQSVHLLVLGLCRLDDLLDRVRHRHRHGGNIRPPPQFLASILL